MKKNKVAFLVQGAMIAALYVVLTLMAAQFNLASGAVQVRFSEVLTVLPFLTGAALFGVTGGCFLANILLGSPAPDIIFGTLATFLGAWLTWKIGQWYRGKLRTAQEEKREEAGTNQTEISARQKTGIQILATLPPVLSNALIIPFVLSYAYHISGSIPFFMLTVGAGEFLSCTVLGMILLKALSPLKGRFLTEE